MKYQETGQYFETDKNKIRAGTNLPKFDFIMNL